MTFTLKEAIIGYISRMQVVSWNLLSDALGESMPNETHESFQRAISELVQSGLIRRYEFTTEANRTRRDEFYMLYGSRLV